MDDTTSRRNVLRKSVITTSGLLFGGFAASGSVLGQGTEVKKIKCGQTKVGHISENKDGVGEDAFGNSEDRYRFVLEDSTRVTVTVVGHGPGFTRGQGQKGGRGQGEGQENSEPFVYIAAEGATPFPFVATGSAAPGDRTAVASIIIGPGTFDIIVQDVRFIDAANEPFKYQVTLECETP